MEQKIIRAAMLGSACAILLPSAAIAQDAFTTQRRGSQDIGLSEIVVTAQRRAENVQDVPAAVQVLTNESLGRSGVNNTLDLTQSVPSLVIGSTTGGVHVALCGIGTDSTSYSIDSPVSFYIDGVYLGNSSALSQDLADVERVEGLKGPQTTLYGRNATGGAVNIITRKPSSDLQAELQLAYGNLNAVNAKAYVSEGADTVAASLVLTYDKRDGYIDNLQLGIKTGDRESYGIRGKLWFEFSPEWDLTLSGDYSRRDDHSGPLQLYGNQPLGALFDAPFTTEINKTYSEFQHGGVDIKDYGASATQSGRIGFADVTSITAYRYNSNFLRQDNECTGLPMLVVKAFAPAKTFSEEIFLTSDTDGPLSWVAGASYLWEERSFDPTTIILGPPLASEPTISFVRGEMTSNALAFYARFSYDIVDKVRLTLGGRYSNESKSLNFLQGEDATGAVTSAANPDKVRFTDFSPKVSLEFRPNPDHLIYASYAEGFRSGTYNLADVAQPGPLEPETIEAWEIGGKHEFFGRRLIANWSAFYYSLSNLFVQSANQNDATSAVGLQNAASARIKGIDVDLTAAVTSRFKITAAASFLDAKFKDFPAAAANVPNPDTGGFGRITVIRDLSGNRSVRAPKLTASLTGTYTVPLLSGEATLYGSLYHNSRF